MSMPPATPLPPARRPPPGPDALPGLEVVPVASAGDAITRRLREAIVYAELPPGTRLRQEELAGRFGTSRVPLREAMRQLTAEGLIDWPSNRSARVRALSLAELEELFALGGLLEPRATGAGVPRLTDADLQQLARLHDEMLQNGLAQAAWYRINLAFHLLPMLRSGQTHTLEMVTAIRSNLTRYFLMPSLFERNGDDWRRKHAAEHADLLAAFSARDGRLAAKLVARHWKSTWDDWRRHLPAGAD